MLSFTFAAHCLERMKLRVHGFNDLDSLSLFTVTAFYMPLLTQSKTDLAFQQLSLTGLL